jgi:hypothetical protein
MAQVALVKGQQYVRKDFGIEGWAAQRTDQVVGGEFYSFFTMIGDKNNIIEADGFVYDVEPATYIPARRPDRSPPPCICPRSRR